MSAGRRMKHEMMVAQRKRRQQQQPPTMEERLEELDVPEGDKAEVRRFAALLADSELPLVDQIAKHGADYLGFTPDEVRTIQSAKETP